MGTSRSTLPVHITSNDDHPAAATSSQTPYMNTDANANRTSRVFRALHPINPFAMSPESDDGVPDRLWFSQDFMLGAGMVIIQPTTGKVVLLREPVGPDPKNPTKTLYYWFLPKGRKDRGESLEQAALREAYEEVSTTHIGNTRLPIVYPSIDGCACAAAGSLLLTLSSTRRTPMALNVSPRFRPVAVICVLLMPC